MKPHLQLVIETNGCLSSCAHCGSQGRPYKAMPLNDIERILYRGKTFCDAHDIIFCPNPGHDTLVHPQAAAMIRLFHSFMPNEPENWWNPMVTNGISLGQRDDWEDVLAAVREVGANTFWFAFHGTGDVHDQLVNRPGAFEAARVAVARVHAAGFDSGCNAFLTKPAAKQFPQMLASLQDMNIRQLNWEIASYNPTPRARTYESLRPELDDLLPWAEQLSATAPWRKEKWLHIEDLTESRYCSLAMSGADATVQGKGAQETKWTYLPPEGTIQLVCDKDLNLYSGILGTHGKRHGNLSADDADTVFAAAIQYGQVSLEELYFEESRVPSVQDLARTVANPEGKQLHHHTFSMRWRWLDLALCASRRY